MWVFTQHGLVRFLVVRTILLIHAASWTLGRSHRFSTNRDTVDAHGRAPNWLTLSICFDRPVQPGVVYPNVIDAGWKRGWLRATDTIPSESNDKPPDQPEAVFLKLALARAPA